MKGLSLRAFFALLLSPFLFGPSPNAAVLQDVPDLGGTWEFLQWHLVEENPARMILTQNGTRLTGRITTGGGAGWDVLGSVDAVGNVNLKRLLPFREFQERGSSIELVRAIAAQIGNAGRNGFIAASIKLTFDKDVGLLKGTYARIAWQHEGDRLHSASEQHKENFFLIRPARPIGDEDLPVGGTWKFRASGTKLFLTQEGENLKGKFETADGSSSWEVKGKFHRNGVIELVRFLSRREITNVAASAVNEALAKYGEPSKPGYFRMTVYLKVTRDMTGMKGYYGRTSISAENGKLKNAEEVYDGLDLVPTDRELLDSFISPGIEDPFDIPDDLTP